MAEWLSIIGIGEDGLAGLTDASREALARSEIVFGGPRHLAMIDHADKRAWPVPFSIAPVLEHRTRPVAALVSGDPFWHGAGRLLAAAVPKGDWRAYPAPSVFSLAAARMGWALERTFTAGAHATPFDDLRPELWPGQRMIVTLRDGAAVGGFANWLTAQGFGESAISVLEHLGGPVERIRQTTAARCDFADVANLVLVAVEVRGSGKALTRASGIADDFFGHDGQITKRPIRALALSALAPRPGELLWDIGLGSGSIAIEWLLSHPSTEAIGIEVDAGRAARARANADRLGARRLDIREGRALDLIAELPVPDAVFLGGGADGALLDAIWQRLPPGSRVVGHAVTLETEALFLDAHARLGGALFRVDLAEAAPLGRKRGWNPFRTITQWSVTR